MKTPLEWQKLLYKLGFEILEDGTTGLTGFKIFQKFPFALINWILMVIFGFFPWQKGESYMVVTRKD